jgi:hypothetical protein
VNEDESPTEGQASRCQQVDERVRIASTCTRLMAVRHDTCTSTASTGALHSGSIPTSPWPPIMGIAGERDGTSSASGASMWRPCAMHGMPSAVVTFTLPGVVSVTVTDDPLSVDLEDGRTIAVPIGW